MTPRQPKGTPSRYRQAVPVRPAVDGFPGVTAEEFALLMAAIKQAALSACLESAARVAVLDAIRHFGLTRPLQAARSMPRPLTRLQALVLEKLEGVAVHLGSP